MAAGREAGAVIDDENVFDFDDDRDTDYSDAEPEEMEEEEDIGDDSCDLQPQDIDLDLSDDGPDEIHYLSKDGSIYWTSKCSKQGRRPAANIITERSGVKGPATEAETELECWELFFPQEMVEIIVQHTNKKLAEIKSNYGRDIDCSLTDVTEMRGFLGLLYLSGLLNLSHVDLHDLYKTNGLSPEYFRAAMRENRFRLLLRALRFDDSEPRADRRMVDKLAPIREIWDLLNQNCLAHYAPSANVTIDEMMAGFRGNCSFKQYIPSKPDRYGIKIFAMVDSETYYTSNMEVYVGQQPSVRTQVSNKPFDVVQRVCSSVLDTGRNITMDNWFSSIPLTIDLLENHNTTCVATLRKNKPQIPPQFVERKGREPSSSLFGFYRKMTLVSYVSKNKTNKKCAILLSSMHKSDVIDPTTGDARKPEVITYYNKTKGAVDNVDQKRGKYDVARCSRRWPLTLWFAAMNVGMIDAWVVYKHNSRTNMKRKDFIERVLLDLTKPLLEVRLQNPFLSFDLRKLIGKCTDISMEQPAEELSERQVCFYCPRSKNRKTKSECFPCSNLICGSHMRKVCTSCYDKMIMLQEDYED